MWLPIWSPPTTPAMTRSSRNTSTKTTSPPARHPPSGSLPGYRSPGSYRSRGLAGREDGAPLEEVPDVTSLPTLPVDSFDLSDLEFWSQPWDVREAAFRSLRAQRPIAFYEEPELPGSAIAIPAGRGYWALTRHADVVEVSRHPELYCSGQSGSTITDMPTELLEFFGSMINMDDPRHARLRRIVSAAFNPRMVRSVEDSIEQVAGDIVEKVAPHGGCDFVTDVAARLPLKVICDMMGVPERDYDR